jgi:hypothetical protein
MKRLYMKTFVKTTLIGATALAMTTFGVPQARAHGWAVAAGVLGGLTAGTIIGASVASAATPVYYSYPAPVYYTPAPAVAVAPAAVPPYAGYASYASSPTYPSAAATAPQPPPVVVQQPAPVYSYPQTVVYAAPYAYPYPYFYPYVRAGYWWGPRYHGYHYRHW